MAAAAQTGRDAIDTTARLTRVPETLGAEDARELRWYLSGSALACQEGSGFGAQLERAALFSAVRECRRCRGTGRVPKRGNYAAALKRWQRVEVKRLGLVVADPEGLMGLALRELGRNVVAAGDVAEVVGPIPDSLLKRCSSCQGVGTVTIVSRTSRARLTARPTGSSRTPWQSIGVVMGDPDLARYGRVSRRLMAVRRADPEGAAALELYYAPGGHYGAVWVLTAAGQQLLADNPQRLHPTLLFANLAVAARDNPEHPRAGTMARASFEAGQLVRRGARAWNEAAG